MRRVPAVGRFVDLLVVVACVAACVVACVVTCTPALAAIDDATRRASIAVAGELRSGDTTMVADRFDEAFFAKMPRDLLAATLTIAMKRLGALGDCDEPRGAVNPAGSMAVEMRCDVGATSQRMQLAWNGAGRRTSRSASGVMLPVSMWLDIGRYDEGLHAARGSRPAICRRPCADDLCAASRGRAPRRHVAPSRWRLRRTRRPAARAGRTRGPRGVSGPLHLARRRARDETSLQAARSGFRGVARCGAVECDRDARRRAATRRDR